MKILYICQHDPFASTGGGGMASHAYLRAFADIASGQLDLICADIVKKKHSEPDPNIKLNKIIYVADRSNINKCLSVLTGHLNRFIIYARKYIKENHKEYDTIVFDHNSIAGPLVEKAKSYGIRTITIHHNYEKEYYYDNHGLRDRVLFLHHVIRCEKKAFLNSDINLFLTEQDKETFRNVYGQPNGKCFVVGVFEYNNKHVFDISNSGTNKDLQLVITGSLCTSQGIDGIKYFFKELYSRVPANFHIVIAGRNPTIEVKKLCNLHDNVKLIPNPGDIEEVIKNGDIYICPTRVGGGLKLRIMDGLKLGLPVISHECSARGYDMFLESPYFHVFSNAKEFEEHLKGLIKLYSNNYISKHEVQNRYLSSFTYQSGLNRLKSFIYTTI